MNKNLFDRIRRARPDVPPNVALAVAAHVGSLNDYEFDRLVDIIDSQLTVEENLELVDKALGRSDLSNVEYYEDRFDWNMEVDWELLLLRDTRRARLPAWQRQIIDFF